jgi:prepilin-type processing-associated H-X9-DG protein
MVRSDTMRHCCQRYGLTLIELTAACACLAVVLTVVPPVLVGTRQRAQSARCMSNLRRIANASVAYAAEDPGENLIPAGHTETPQMVSPVLQRLANYAYGGRSGIGGPNPAQQFSASVYGWSWRMGSAHRPLNAMFYKGGFKAPINRYDLRDTQIDASVYQCPGDDGFQGVHYYEWAKTTHDNGWSSYRHFGTSYSAIVFWTALASGATSSNSAYLRPAYTIPNPGNTLIYIENVGRYCWNHHDPAAVEYGGPFSGILPNPEYPEALGGPEWHGEGWHFNAAFADGHVARTKIKSYTKVVPYPSGMLGFCASDGGGDTGPCTWIMIRGRGWQMDTLPAPPIETTHVISGDGGPSQDATNIVGWIEDWKTP